MNFKSICYYLGLSCFPISALSFVNILYSSYFDYFLSINSYISTLGISFFVGLIFFFIGKKSIKRINFIEQLLLIIFIYFLNSILIALPFYLSNYQVTFINALFESISGLTGTGFSIFEDIKYLDPTLIIWRSSSQWIGGLYFLFFLILIFSNKKFSYKMTDLTYSSDGSINSENNIKNLLFKIFILYSFLSFCIFLSLNIFEVRMFNSLNLSMSLISTGGFLPTDSLEKIINSNSQKIVFVISLLISMLNFFLIFNFFKTKIILREHKEDLYLLFLTIIFIMFVSLSSSPGLDTIISVISSISNSGLSLIQPEENLSLFYLLIVSLGGSIVSNTSGIKFIRVYILIKTVSSEINKLISPNSIINKNMFNTDKRITDENVKISFLIFISFFISLFILSGILIVDQINFENSFKLSILTITNTTTSTMFGMDDLNFASLLTTSKLSLIIFMIIGKIELISIFLIIKKCFFKD